jgi:hypothetical protein
MLHKHAIQTKQPLNRAMCAGAPCSMNICVQARFSAVFRNNSESQHGRIATTCSISNCERFAIYSHEFASFSCDFVAKSDEFARFLGHSASFGVVSESSLQPAHAKAYQTGYAGCGMRFQ